jgi:hypothetical protein
MDKKLSDLIGWNSLRRRNFGFLLAWEMEAEIVATIDDDNIPLPGWGQQLFAGQEVEANVYETDLPVFDPIGATNYPHLWHRGYPLQLLPQRDYSKVSQQALLADVQADFWDGDPDVDAICRMQFLPECRFDPSPFPIASTVMSPFDSQNTFLSRRWLPEYFLFPHVGRMDDIWASYYLQARGARVVYGSPSVVQERHEHDLIVDMKEEYLGYEHNLRIVEALREDPDALLDFLPPEAAAAFDRYQSLF